MKPKPALIQAPGLERSMQWAESVHEVEITHTLGRER
jgi:hypothetical protein